jgi:hypothetical protein
MFHIRVIVGRRASAEELLQVRAADLGPAGVELDLDVDRGVDLDGNVRRLTPPLTLNVNPAPARNPVEETPRSSRRGRRRCPRPTSHVDVDVRVKVQVIVKVTTDGSALDVHLPNRRGSAGAARRVSFASSRRPRMRAARYGWP